jgi:hypothetical protein
MTEERSPLDAALDVLVFVPLGLAATAAEEFPKLAAKGRAQLLGRLTVARMVGEFAVAQGRREVGRRFGQAARPGASQNGGTGTIRTAESTGPGPGTGGIHGDAGAGAAGGGAAGGGAAGAGSPGSANAAGGSDAAGRGGEADHWPQDPDDPVVVDVAETTRPPSGDPVVESPPADAAGLAIPGYDSLSASQVVQRLDGLSRDELAAVGEYESAHRARRTVLTRVSQLQGSS